MAKVSSASRQRAVFSRISRKLVQGETNGLRSAVPMSVGTVLVALQAWFKNGRGAAKKDFLDPLYIRPGEVEATRANSGDWESGMVYFAVVQLSTFAEAVGPTEAFHARVIEAFRATAW